jgi:outer membrane lipoprotein-sorting protein
MRRILLATAFTLISVLVIAQDGADPAAILRGAALFGQFTSLEVHLTMEIHERRGTKDRGLVAYVERDGDDAKALVQIVSPAFLNSMKFLSITDGEDTTQWLGTSRGVRRVAASSSNDRLFDSDFTVEDLSDYDPNDFDLTITGSERINGSDAYVLEAVPLDIETDYAKRVMYVDKETGLLVLARFLDASGTVVREFELLEHMDLDGVAFPRVARMTTVSSNTYTILTVDDAQAGHDIPDRIFNRGNL